MVKSKNIVSKNVLYKVFREKAFSPPNPLALLSITFVPSFHAPHARPFTRFCIYIYSEIFSGLLKCIVFRVVKQPFLLPIPLAPPFLIFSRRVAGGDYPFPFIVLLPLHSRQTSSNPSKSRGWTQPRGRRRSARGLWGDYGETMGRIWEDVALSPPNSPRSFPTLHTHDFSRDFGGAGESILFYYQAGILRSSEV